MNEFGGFRPQELTKTSEQLRPNSSSVWTLGPTDCQWIRDPSTTGSRFDQKWTHPPRSVFSRSLVVSQPLGGTKNRYRYSKVIPVLEPPPVLETRTGTVIATGTGF